MRVSVTVAGVAGVAGDCAFAGASAPAARAVERRARFIVASMVSVEPKATDSELTGRETQLPALIRLVPVQNAPARPRAFLEATLLDRLDAGDRIRAIVRQKFQDHPGSGDEKLIVAGLDDEASVSAGNLGLLPRARGDRRRLPESDVEG